MLICCEDLILLYLEILSKKKEKSLLQKKVKLLLNLELDIYAAYS